MNAHETPTHALFQPDMPRALYLVAACAALCVASAAPPPAACAFDAHNAAP
jgi:hypothetical protein